MIAFFLSIAVLICVALALLLPALLRRRATRGNTVDPNLAAARQRAVELAADLEAGLIDREAHRRLRVELEQNLAPDLADELNDTPRRGAHGLGSAVALTLLIPLASGLIYLMIGNPAALQAPHPSNAPAVSVEPLQSRVQQNPDDAEGWLYLGRAYSARGEHQLASQAYERVLALAGDHPVMLVLAAESMTMAAGGRVTGRASDLIQRALALDANNPQALWLAGVAAQQAGNGDAAIAYWQTLEPLLADRPEQQAQVRGMIRAAETADTEAAGGVSPASPELRVSVSLAEQLAHRVTPDQIVYVLARAAQGPAMPLAVRRLRVSELPANVSLSDADAMSPEHKLSLYPEVVVAARISLSGDAIAAAGDLEGQTGQLDLRETDRATVLIDGVRQ